MMLNPIRWSWKTHVLTWLPVAGFIVTMMINWTAISASFPLATKSWVRASFAGVEDQVNVLLIMRLQDEIGRESLRRDRLKRRLDAEPGDVDARRDWIDALRKIRALEARLDAVCADDVTLTLFC